MFTEKNITSLVIIIVIIIIKMLFIIYLVIVKKKINFNLFNISLESGTSIH